MKKISFVLQFFLLFPSFSPLEMSGEVNEEIPINYFEYTFCTRYSFNDNFKSSEFESQILFELDSLTIPIKRAGNLILLETIIDGQSGNLIFDSGAASEIVLNSTYFRDYKISGNRSTTGINGSVQEVGIANIDSLIISDLTFKDKYVELIDLNQIENRIGLKILGFFGLQLINDYEIVIDLSKDELQLFKLDRKGNRLNSGDQTQSFDYSQGIEISNNVLFIWARIAGKNLRFCFDTAAEKNIISHIAPKRAINTITITGRAKITDPGSTKKEVLYGKMNDFMLGKKQIKNMEALIADIGVLSRIYKIDIAGVLGYDFLNQGRISINIKKKQLGINFNKEVII